jgi:hypothetical protein
MTKDLTEYNEILQKARTMTIEHQAPIVKEFVPQLYKALKKQGYEIGKARDKVVKDGKEMGWKEQTIVDELPIEAKNAAMSQNGLKGSEAKKQKALTTVAHWIQGNTTTYTRIVEAYYASPHQLFEIGINSKYDFLDARAVKSKAPEPITVQTNSVKSSSAPVTF